ncbi:Rep family protein, partial [Campylobacter concisus]
MSQDNKNVKKRNWAFVAYPESMPANWLEILQET